MSVDYAKQFQEIVEGRFCPVVLVRTTPDVEDSCMKNGLQFIEMLRPYQRTQKECALIVHLLSQSHCFTHVYPRNTFFFSSALLSHHPYNLCTRSLFTSLVTPCTPHHFHQNFFLPNYPCVPVFVSPNLHLHSTFHPHTLQLVHTPHSTHQCTLISHHAYDHIALTVHCSVYIRTTKEYESYSLKNFGLRFRNLQELEHENSNEPAKQSTEQERGYYDFLGTTVRECAIKNDEVMLPDIKELKQKPFIQVYDKCTLLLL